MKLIQAFPPSWKSLLAFAIGLRATTATHNIALKVFIVLCALNWRNVPFFWHIRCFAWLPLYRFRVYLISKGLLRPPREARGKALGLKGVETALTGIGRSPFEVIYTTNEWVSLADADINMHLSNSTYLQLGDFNRFRWAIALSGPIFAREGIMVALAETRYTFLREIPIFSPYQLEVRVATYDHQWAYLYLRFTLPMTKRALDNPSFIKVKDSKGNDRVLAACGIARGCYKLPGHSRSIAPARMYMLGGSGPDASNWELYKALRRKKQSKQFLLEEGTPQEMEIYEERRKTAHDLLQQITDKASWIRFDAITLFYGLCTEQICTMPSSSSCNLCDHLYG